MGAFSDTTMVAATSVDNALRPNDDLAIPFTFLSFSWRLLSRGRDAAPARRDAHQGSAKGAHACLRGPTGGTYSFLNYKVSGVWRSTINAAHFGKRCVNQPKQVPNATFYATNAIRPLRQELPTTGASRNERRAATPTEQKRVRSTQTEPQACDQDHVRSCSESQPTGYRFRFQGGTD